MSERSEIKRDGASAQKNTGRGQYQKGDARWRNFVVDYKEYSKSFSLNKSSWAKICTDTFKVNRNYFPVLKVILGDGNEKTRLAVIEWALLEDLLDCWEWNNDSD